MKDIYRFGSTRIEFGRFRPRLNLRFGLDEDSKVWFSVAAGWSAYVTLPIKVPIKQKLYGEQTGIQLEWDTDARLPSLHLWLWWRDDDCEPRSYKLIDLLEVVLGKWDAPKEVVREGDAYLNIQDKKYPVHVTISVRRPAWRRQWWKPKEQWEANFELLTGPEHGGSNVEGWPDPRRGMDKGGIWGHGIEAYSDTGIWHACANYVAKWDKDHANAIKNRDSS